MFINFNFVVLLSKYVKKNGTHYKEVQLQELSFCSSCLIVIIAYHKIQRLEKSGFIHIGFFVDTLLNLDLFAGTIILTKLNLYELSLST